MLCSFGINAHSQHSEGVSHQICTHTTPLTNPLRVKAKREVFLISHNNLKFVTKWHIRRVSWRTACRVKARFSSFWLRFYSESSFLSRPIFVLFPSASVSVTWASIVFLSRYVPLFICSLYPCVPGVLLLYSLWISALYRCGFVCLFSDFLAGFDLCLPLHTEGLVCLYLLNYWTESARLWCLHLGPPTLPVDLWHQM